MPCRDARQALGVYVLGAIDPAERALVEAHLSACESCRTELAGLAGLPALLGRVPPADAEMLALDADWEQGDEPPPELLESLLHRVAARRQARRWRGLAAAAAAVVIAVGGGLLAASLGGGQSGPALDTASASNPRTHVSAVVDFSPSTPERTVRVQVSGVAAGSTCRLWVVSRDGRRTVAGSWTVLPGYGTGHWYPVRSPVALAGVRAFDLTQGRTVLLTIRAG
ncbi:MAG: anti-sigma factor family protein [Streptosporangiaceae bacterium]